MKKSGGIKLWMPAAGFMILFVILLAVRLDLPARLFHQKALSSLMIPAEVPDRQSWKNILLNDEKIGYSHSALTRKEDGYRLEESIFMRINIMGTAQDLRMRTSADLNPDFSIAAFDFNLGSGIFSFQAAGRMKNKRILEVETISADTRNRFEIPLDHRPFLTAGLIYAVAREPDFSETSAPLTFHIFDPASMSQQPVVIRVEGKETIPSMAEQMETTRLALTYKGVAQTAWIDDKGDIIREKGLLGLTLEKTTKSLATADLPAGLTEDLTRLASVSGNGVIADPRNTRYLKARISGMALDNLDIQGGRQSLEDDILTITAEKISDAATLSPALSPALLPDEVAAFLSPEPFIQSDDQRVIAAAASIAAPDAHPADNARALVKWVFETIEKRPVFSVPDAVAVLLNRVGDCNEHAVLLAALARAAGIPAKIEAGLVYLDGRFYYHAWNLLYVGEWISADATFGQMPADATHIRLVSGSPGDQLDLLGVIDNIVLRIIETDY
jgi:hypothetical protein